MTRYLLHIEHGTTAKTFRALTWGDVMLRLVEYGNLAPNARLQPRFKVVIKPDDDGERRR